MTNTLSCRPCGPLLLAALLTLASACGGGGGGDGGNGASGGSGGAGASCSEASRKQWVLDVARDWYLFPETLPASVDLAAYPTAEDLLDALTANAREQGKDRYFSYLTTRTAENALLGDGQFVGFGFRNRADEAGRVFVLDVYERSPAADAGLQRGDEIVAVDAGSGFVTVAQALAEGRSLSDLLGPAEAGVTRGLRILRAGATLDIRMSKRTVTIDPVPDAFGTAVLPLAGTTGVGYLHLRSYTAPADPQLRSAFADFRARGLEYFIVDLRYNGGGLVSTAELIDNLFGGGRASTEVQYRIVYNAARAGQNSTVRFQPQAQSVRPVRIAFLTTGATASASEINVNALKPYVETAIVGSNTLGKPVGQIAFDLAGCEDRLRLVAFRTVNADGEGDYYSGLASSMRYACAAPDTLDAPLGSSDDSLVREAMYWLGTGSCRTLMPQASASGASKPGFGRPPLATPPPASEVERWLPGLE
ncbi:MAG: S41 family peptidase [Steroidobacteraceae bacterium]